MKVIPDFFSLTIRLGWKCNGKCIYCSVGKYLNQESENLSIDENIYDYISRWSQSATPVNIKGLGFYGGEPLLYFDLIKTIIGKLESKKAFNKEWIRYRIITNGVLLNQEIVDFCNKKSILITLSYDAPTIEGLRNIHLLDSQIPLFLSLKYRQVQFVYNAVNARPLLSKLYLEKKFPNTQVRCSVYANYNDHIMPELSQFNRAELILGLEELLNYYKDREPDLVFQRIFSVARRIGQFDLDKFNGGQIQCIAGRGVALDLHGNIYICSNCSEKAADIYDGNYEVLRTKCRQDIVKRILPRCRSCKYLSICWVYCPLAYVYNGEYENCAYHRMLYDFVLKHEYEIKKVLNRASYDIAKGYGLCAFNK